MSRTLSERMARLLPILLVVVALVTGGVLAGMLELSPVVSLQYVRTTADANGVRATIWWLVSYIVYIVSLVWTAIVAIAVVNEHLTKRGLFITGVSATLAMMAGRALAVQSAVKPRSILTAVDRATQLPIHSTSLVSSTLWAGVLVLIIAAAVALGTRSTAVIAENDLRRRVGEARLLLFSAAELLASALVALHLTNVWPVDLPAVPGAVMSHEVLQHVAVTVTLASGVFYTIALIMLFVPVAIIHERWIEECWSEVHATNSSQTRSGWLAETGLDRSVVDTAAQIVAIAAPWIAAVGLPSL